jgi:oligopeptide transport system substrate-binding protein
MKKYLLLLLVMFFITSCVKKLDKYDESKKNVLLVDIGMNPPTLDPAKAEDAYSFRVVNDLFSGLIDFDQKNNPILGLANKIEVSQDKRKYTFHLRHDLFFSDGLPITAYDVVYSWQRLVDPKTAASYNFLLYNIVNANEIIKGNLDKKYLGVHAKDKYTIVVDLVNSNNDFLTYLTVPVFFIVPKHIVMKFQESWTQPQNIVTSGAYILKENILNGYIKVLKNHNYYDESMVMIPEIIFFPYNDINVSLANFKTNNLDTTWQNLPVDQYVSLKKYYKKQLHTVAWERIDYIAYNMKLSKFNNNLKLRKALSIVINRDLIVKKVLQSGQSPLCSVVTKTIENGKYGDVKYSWCNDNMQNKINLAKKLYKEAGYSKDNPLTITLKYKTNDLYKKVALAIASIWESQLGVRVLLQNEDWQTLMHSLHTANYDVVIAGWGADYNLVTTYTPLYLCNNPNNHSHYCNQKYDELIKLADTAENESFQIKLYKKALNIVLNDYINIPLFQPTHQRLISNRLQGYNMESNYLDNVQSKWMYFK